MYGSRGCTGRPGSQQAGGRRRSGGRRPAGRPARGMLTTAAAGLLVLLCHARGQEPLCSLNGELDTSSGKCVCDPGWKGRRCSTLAVARSRVLWPQLADGDPRTTDSASLSWGGSLMQDPITRLWHGWFNVGCQTPTSFMHTYRTGAVHAISSAVEGPYNFADVSVPAEIENPMAVADGRGGVLIAYLDHAYPNGSSITTAMPCFGARNGTLAGSKPRPSTAARFPAHSGCATLQPESHPADPKVEGRRLAIASAPSAGGPWSYTFPRIGKADLVAADGDILCGINPSLHRLSNGTWLLATRYDSPVANRSKLTLATAPSWRGPYTVVSHGDQWRAGVATGGSEDPFVYQNFRGFHMIYHDGPHGRHVWSRDGRAWTGYTEPSSSQDNRTDAYTMMIEFDDGMRVDVLRRERPWLMLDTDGHPLFLLTGCETCGVEHTNCRSYTVLTPLLPLGRSPAQPA
jgi:hypothetical protein